MNATEARIRFDRTVMLIRLALAVLAGGYLLGLLFDIFWLAASLGVDAPDRWATPSWFAARSIAVLQPIVVLWLALLLSPRRGPCTMRLPSLLLFGLFITSADGIVLGMSAMLAEVPSLEARAANLYYDVQGAFEPYEALRFWVVLLLDLMLWIVLAVVIRAQRGPVKLIVLYAVSMLLWYLGEDVLYHPVASGRGGTTLYMAYFVVRALGIAGFSACLLWIRVEVARLLPAPPDTCPRCRYPMEGLSANRCPECGEWISFISASPLGRGEEPETLA